jgi:hypothetical protein
MIFSPDVPGRVSQRIHWRDQPQLDLIATGSPHRGAVLEHASGLFLCVTEPA